MDKNYQKVQVSKIEKANQICIKELRKDKQVKVKNQYMNIMKRN